MKLQWEDSLTRCFMMVNLTRLNPFFLGHKKINEEISVRGPRSGGRTAPLWTISFMACFKHVACIQCNGARVFLSAKMLSDCYILPVVFVSLLAFTITLLAWFYFFGILTVDCSGNGPNFEPCLHIFIYIYIYIYTLHGSSLCWEREREKKEK